MYVYRKGREGREGKEGGQGRTKTRYGGDALAAVSLLHTDVHLGTVGGLLAGVQERICRRVKRGRVKKGGMEGGKESGGMSDTPTHVHMHIVTCKHTHVCMSAYTCMLVCAGDTTL